MAVLAAAFLVGAVALAMLGPTNVTLGAALYMLDHDVLDALEGGIHTHLSPWLWDDVVMPLLLRPAWLLPAAAGLICIGVSLSFGSRQRPQRTHRRRF